MYELNKHKRNDAIKWVIVFVSILVIITVVLAILSSGFTNWNVKTWFGRTDETEQTDPDKDKTPVTDGKGNILDKSVNPLPASGLLFASSYAAEAAYSVSNSVTVTATITPATADNRAVDWSVEWINASDGWASGKTASNYVTVAPTSDGSLTATVTCAEAFGAQINVVVTSRMNPDAKAVVPVDYYKRLSGLSVSQTYDSSSHALSSGLRIDKATSFSFSPELGTGTIEESQTYSATIEYTPAFKTYMENFAYEDLGGSTFGDMCGTGYNQVKSINVSSFTINEKFVCDLTSPDNSGLYNVNDAYYNILEIMRMYTGDIFVLKIAAVANGTSATYNTSFNVPLDKTGVTIGVSSVTINTDSIKF